MNIRRLLVTCLTLLAGAAQAADPQWTLIQYPRLADHHVLFDSGRHALVVFENEDRIDLMLRWLPADTAGTWQTLPVTTNAFLDLSRPSIAFDAAGRRAFAFSKGALWTLALDAAAWRRTPLPGFPDSARTDPALAYDSARDRVILYGGRVTISGQPRSLGDAYEIRLAPTISWAPLPTRGTSPGPRSGTTAVYDAAGDRVFLFGGSLEAFGNEFPDSSTWTLTLADTATWAQFATLGIAPSPRVLAQVVLDSEHDRLLVGSGRSRFAAGTGVRLEDLFALDMGGRWSKIPGSANAPPPGFALTYDPERDLFWAHGGSTSPSVPRSGSTNVVRRLSAATLTWDVPPSPRNPPPAALARAVVYAAHDDRSLWFGLETAPGIVWELTFPRGVPTWRRIVPSGTAPPRVGGAAYDELRDRVLLYPDDGTSIVYALALGATPSWSAITTTGPVPGPRRRHELVYDSIRDRLLLHGGTANEAQEGSGRNDTWSLDLSSSPAWSLLLPGGTPPRNYRLTAVEGEMGIVFDPALDRLLLRQKTYIDTGASPIGVAENFELRGFDGSLEWHLLPGTPEPVADHPGYDPRRARMLCPGRSPGGVNDEAVHALPPGSNLVTTPAIDWQRGGAGIFDPLRDQLIVFGGAFGDPVDDVAILSFGDPPPPPDFLALSSCPAERAWTAGASLPLQAVVRAGAATDQDVRYELTGERAWPGLPLMGMQHVAAGVLDTLRFALAVPDTAALGYQLFRLKVSYLGAPGVGDSCTFSLGEASPGPPPTPSLDLAGCPPEQAWMPGAILPVTATIVNDGDVDGVVHYELTGERTWPGLPIVGTSKLPAGATDTIEFALAVPDTAAPGYQAFHLDVSYAGSPDIRDSCTFMLGEPSPGPPLTPGFALAPIVPNPSTGSMTLSFSVAEAGDIVIEMRDLRGRRVRRFQVSDVPAGSMRTITLAPGVSPGRYWVRLIQGDQATTQSVVIIGR